MRLFSFESSGLPAVGMTHQEGYVDLGVAAPNLPKSIAALLKGGKEIRAELDKVAKNPLPVSIKQGTPSRYLLPLPTPEKIVCVGLNYAAHIEETKRMKTESPYPILFTRFASTLVPHEGALVVPNCSSKFDYEGELVAVIGKTARHVKAANALDYVAAYSIFNDATVRDYQSRTHQWTLGKNFDASGGFGPFIVMADALPLGGIGLRIQTRLNGQTVQDASTADMIFSLPELIENITEVMTLNPGDIIVTGTPAGVGMARTPPLYMKAGDAVEVEIEGIGLLKNTVKAES